MNLIETITDWFGFKPPVQPEVAALRTALEKGCQAKYSEDYETAMAELDEALLLAGALRDSAAITVIMLHQSEVLRQQGKWDEAEQMLTALLQNTRETKQAAQASLTLCGLGALAQAQGNWAAARKRYEEALDLARTGRAAGIEGRAMGHLADTYLRDGNASYAEHLLRDALPLLKAGDDLELSSHFVGLLGQSLIQNGNDIEGQQLLLQALQLASHLKYHYYERHWSLVLGQRAYTEARYHDAKTHYERALNLFPLEARAPEYVRALCQASQMYLSLREFEPALTHAQNAVGIAKSMDNDIRALAEGALGTVLRMRGRSNEAIPHLQQSISIYNGEHTSQQIEILRNLAAAQAEVGDEVAVETYERAIEWADQINAALDAAQSRRDLGLFYSKRGKLLAAIQMWQAVIPVYEDKRFHAQVARLYADIGNARKRLGQQARALKDYEQALMTLNYVDEADYETRGVVLSNAANAYADQGDVDSADSFFNDAISFAEKLGDQVAESLRRGNYGWFLALVGRPRRSIAMLEQAIALSRELNLPLQQAVQSDNLGLAYDALSEYQAALRHHQAALDMLEALNAPRWHGLVSVNVAKTLMALHKIDEARTHLENAAEHEQAVDDYELTIQIATARARLALLDEHPAATETLLTDAINLARRNDQKRLLAETLSVRSEQQAALGQVDAAKQSWTEAQRIYSILRMPQAKLKPDWLRDRPPQS